MATLSMTLLALMVVLVSPALAGSQTHSGTLAGLRGVGVLVDDLHPDAERDGLTRSALQTDVELRLRQFGVGVLTSAERDAASGNPTLYLNVHVMKPTLGLYAYRIDLELAQLVTLVRDPSVIDFTRTWKTSVLGTVGAERLSIKVREAVRDMVDQFINAYLAANPKR